MPFIIPPVKYGHFSMNSVFLKLFLSSGSPIKLNMRVESSLLNSSNDKMVNNLGKKTVAW